jgi:GNAT superfamily N-acetyltransferase
MSRSSEPNRGPPAFQGEVRPATTADAEAIAEIHVAAWQVAYRHAFPAEKLDALTPEERVERWRRNLEEQTVFVADDGTTVIGWASAGRSREAEDEGELYGLYVAPEAWGRGAGRALIGRVEEELAREHAEAILWVLEDNPRARRFYELAGWELDGGRKRDVFLGVEVDEVRYRKALRRAA